MRKNYNILSPSQLMEIFMANVNSCCKYIKGKNPFTILVNGALINVYIKNLSPARLSNHNPDIWRIQLPIKSEFLQIKESTDLFILLGYDKHNSVFTSWNPYWCKQRLNIGKSVSMYSRLSLQQNVNKSREIQLMNLNNDGSVVCIPQNKIGQYIMNIKQYYPEESEFVAKGSSIQKRKRTMNISNNLFEIFINNINKPGDFKQFMISQGITESASNRYIGQLVYAIKFGYINKYSSLFIAKKKFKEYTSAVHEFLHKEDVILINRSSHGYLHTSLNHYIKFLVKKYDNQDVTNDLTMETEKCSLSDSEQISRNYDTVDKELKNDMLTETEDFPVNEFGQLTALDLDLKRSISKFIVGEEYPDYDEMINIVTRFYPTIITDKMSYVDWIKLFENENWKNKKIYNTDSNRTVSSKTRSKNLRVVRRDGSVIQHGFAVDTYIQVIKESNPELIMKLGIKHAGVNIVSTEFDKKYKEYQRNIGNGFLVMVNSSTENKYEDLIKINSTFNLRLNIELIDIYEKKYTNVKEYTKNNGQRYKIRVTFPNGRTIEYQKVLETLVEVVEYAGPERVEALNISVCFHNLILSERLEQYWNACKPLSNGQYVNTASDTVNKYNQICQISDCLNLELIVKLV